MTCKRQRTAWSALSESEPRLFTPHQTQVVHANPTAPYIITIHAQPPRKTARIGETPRSVRIMTPQPAPQSPAHSAVARSLLPAMNQTDGDAHPLSTPDSLDDLSEEYVEASDVVPATMPPEESPQLAPFDDVQIVSQTPSQNVNHTPLILHASDIRRAQVELSLTPSTPPSVLFLPHSTERAARDLLSSTRKRLALSHNSFASDVRPAARRLSTVSAVTPIPLMLESDDIEEADTLPSREPSQHHSQPLLLPPQHPRPNMAHNPQASPITPAALPVNDARAVSTDLQNHVDIVADDVRDATASVQQTTPPVPPRNTLLSSLDLEPPVGNQPQKSDKLAPKDMPAPEPPRSLFKTGKGETIPIPKTNVPMFKTDKGLPLTTPRVERSLFASSVTGGESLFKTANGTAIPIPKTEKPLFMTGKGAPIPVPNLSEKGAPPDLVRESLFTTGKGVPVPVPKTTTPFVPLSSSKKDTSLFGTDAADQPLFATGKGVPIPIPKTSTTPLFTTGKGVPLTTPKVDRFLFNVDSGRESMFTTGKGVPLQIPKTDTPLFTTGKGVPLVPPLSKRTPMGTSDGESAFRSDKGTSVSNPQREKPLFTNGKGVPLVTPESNRSLLSGSVLKQPSGGTKSEKLILSGSTPFSSTGRKPLRTLLSKTASTPRTPGTEPHGLRRSLFQEKTGNGITPPSAPTSLIRSRRGGAKVGSRMRGTPFKRPRQVARPDRNQSKPKKPVPIPVPKFSVPHLSTAGSMIPLNREHIGNRSRVRPSLPTFDFVFGVGCLERSLHHVFSKRDFGSIGLLPADVRSSMHLDELTAFGVGTCISWIERLFPAVSKKPATCVGSAAWTRLSYALAVWKLGRLTYSDRVNSRSRRSFLCAANVTRELLRRISIEWHTNRQPHLLRIMRRDSSPASHIVLLIADLQESAHGDLIVTVTDGWYVAFATLDRILEKRVRSGKLRIGDKVHLTGSSLRSSAAVPPFFFGEGDELGSGFLRLFGNGLRKRLTASHVRLGLQRLPIILRSIQSIRDNGGPSPILIAVVLRSYPVFFMETIQESGEDSDKRPKFICRRQDGEDEARASFDEAARRKLATGSRDDYQGNVPIEDGDIVQRKVSSVLELLICGINDSGSNAETRKCVRMYNPAEDTVGALTDGRIIRITQLLPKIGGWTCAPTSVVPTVDQYGASKSAGDHLLARHVCSTAELVDGKVCTGSDFDGVFSLVYVTECEPDANNRFAYFVDELRNANTTVLALELVGDDVHHLPIPLRMKGGMAKKFVQVVLKDARFEAVDEVLGLVHVKATLRTTIASSKAFKRKQKNIALTSRIVQLESAMKGKQAQLEILKEAVLAFASGNRRSIGAYFTGTQDT